jgi:hypothetical protein
MSSSSAPGWCFPIWRWRLPGQSRGHCLEAAPSTFYHNPVSRWRSCSGMVVRACNSSYLRERGRRILHSRAAQANLARSYLEKQSRNKSVTQAVEHLISKHQSLGSVLSTASKQTNNKQTGEDAKVLRRNLSRFLIVSCKGRNDSWSLNSMVWTVFPARQPTPKHSQAWFAFGLEPHVHILPASYDLGSLSVGKILFIWTPQNRTPDLGKLLPFPYSLWANWSWDEVGEDE